VEKLKFDPRGLLRNQQIILLGVLLAMAAFFTSQNSIFLTNAVFGNIISDWVPLVLIAIGETYVIVSGGIDLSVGSAVGLSGIMAALSMRYFTAHNISDNLGLLFGLLISVLVGTAVGLLNGFLITKAKMVPFVSTLVTLGAARGLCIVLTSGGPIADGPSNAISLSVPRVGPFSYPGLFVLALVVVLGLFMHKARFGRYTFAIGSNAFAARSAGINVNRHLVKIYALSGFLAGIAGMYFYLRLGVGSPTSGQNGELNAIAAVVIGGASLSGGVGKLLGTALGSLILVTVTSGLIIIGVAANWNQVVVAILIAAAVFSQGLRTLGKKNK
jgi:ribose transport system permease protein